jgi:hypothetical protein
VDGGIGQELIARKWLIWQPTEAIIRPGSPLLAQNNQSAEWAAASAAAPEIR